MKNAALVNLSHCLFTEYKDAVVRINCFCVHHGVTDFEGDKNQLGFPGISGAETATVITALAKGVLDANAKVLCGTDYDATRNLAKGITALK